MWTFPEHKRKLCVLRRKENKLKWRKENKKNCLNLIKIVATKTRRRKKIDHMIFPSVIVVRSKRKWINKPAASCCKQKMNVASVSVVNCLLNVWNWVKTTVFSLLQKLTQTTTFYFIRNFDEKHAMTFAYFFFRFKFILFVRFHFANWQSTYQQKT